MEQGSIVNFLDNKTILVTGATGFLAKIFVEKILRVQPNVKKLYLLVRAEDDKSALQRFNTEVVATDLFKVLKEKYGENLETFLSEKVTMVAGDITRENLGLLDSFLKQEMWRHVDIVVNAAASTNFHERYDVALGINTFGAKYVLDFAKKCANIKQLLHVSTAYVSGEKPGPIHETSYFLGETLNGETGLDIDQEKGVIEKKLKGLESYHNANSESIKLAMKELGIQRANLYGWPNTYVFTKALGEMIIGHFKGDIPLVIVRPTIISSTYREPFPGWIEGIMTIDSVILGYGKGKLSRFLGDHEIVYDVVPADMVVNAMIAAIMAHANQTCSQNIYHVGSSVSNPLKFEKIVKCIYQYFTQHPWIGNDGKPVIVCEVIMLKSMASFHRYMTIYYLFPLQILKAINIVLFQVIDGTCTDLERKINWILRIAELYELYAFSTVLYDNVNIENLCRGVREERDFYFGSWVIDWEDYFLHTHVPGLVKYGRK